MSGNISGMSDLSSDSTLTPTNLKNANSNNPQSQSQSSTENRYDDVGTIFGKNLNAEEKLEIEVEGFDDRKVAGMTVGNSAKFQKDVDVQVNLDGVGKNVVGMDVGDDATVRGSLKVKMVRPKK